MAVFCITLAGTVQFAMKKYNYYTKAVPLPNGKRKYVRAKTKEDLERKLSSLRTELSYGIDVSCESTFKDYAEYWIAATKEGNVAGNTLYRYRRILELHVYPILGSKKLRDIRAPLIRQTMLRSKNLSRGTQEVVLWLIRSVFDSAVDDDIILRTPVPKRLEACGDPAKEVEALTPEQERQLLDAAKDLAVYPIVLALMETGMRRGEVTGLMWSDIDFEQDRIFVRRHVVTDPKGKPEVVDGAKTAAGVRVLPLTAALKSYLLSAPKKSVYVFPNSKGGLYSAAALSNNWKTLDNRVGFHTHPHQLRHTYCTKLFESGLDLKQVQYLLGHADPDTTLKVYTHYREGLRHEETLRRAREALSV